VCHRSQNKCLLKSEKRSSDFKEQCAQLCNTLELGTSLFEIALSLFALEQTFILGAMALLETKSEAL